MSEKIDIEEQDDVVKARSMDYDGDTDDYAKVVVTRDLLDGDREVSDVLDELLGHIQKAHTDDTESVVA